MYQRTLIARKTVHAAAWALVAATALALALAACGPGPTNGGPTPSGDIGIAVTVIGDGRVTLTALDFDCRDTCTFGVDEGTDVSLAAVPNAGRVLVAWEGPCSPFGDTCAWTADEDVAVTVTFARHALRFDLKGDGEGYFSIGAPGDATECREACGVAIDSQLPSLDVAVQYYSDGPMRTTLDPWIGCDHVDAANTYCLVTVSGATTIEKTWRAWPRLTLDRGGTGNGNVTSNPGNIDVDAGRTSADVAHGTTVTLTATPADDSTFTSWTGVDCQGGNGDLTCEFVIEESTDVTATLTKKSYDLNGSRTGTGNVTSNPGDIDLDAGTTSHTFTHGTTVSLTATPTSGTTFTGWAGGPCDGESNATCTFAIVSDSATTATFDVRVLTLTVTASGLGAGNVVSTPEGIDLDASEDNASFDYGTSITLSAQAGIASTFDAWTSGPCAGDDTPECVFVIQEATNVNAAFELATP